MTPAEYAAQEQERLSAINLADAVRIGSYTGPERRSRTRIAPSILSDGQARRVAQRELRRLAESYPDWPTSKGES